MARDAGQALTAIRAERLARRIEKVLAGGHDTSKEKRDVHGKWTSAGFTKDQIDTIKSHWEAEQMAARGENEYDGVPIEDYIENELTRMLEAGLTLHEVNGGMYADTLEDALRRIGDRRGFKIEASERVLAKDSNRTAKAIIHDEVGNVLVIKDATYDTWDLPGGHLMEGESLDQGLHREVKEETGLEIVGESWRNNTNDGRTELFDAQVFGVKPRVTLSDEHTAFKWVEPDKAEELAAFWFQDAPGTIPGSSRAGFYPQTGPMGVPGHQNALNAKQRVRDEAEKQVGKAVNRVVTLAEAEVLAKKPASDDFWTYAAAAFFGAIMAAYGESARALAVIERGADHGDVATEAEERAHAEQRAALLEEFPRRIRERLEAELHRGLELNETEAELHRRIGVEGERIMEGEGRVVAETEAQAICGAATMRALKRAGFETCFWVTVGDERVRESHTACEAAGAVKLGDKFPNGCRFPGDPLAPLAETINCRCWLEGASRKSQPVAASEVGQVHNPEGHNQWSLAEGEFAHGTTESHAANIWKHGFDPKKTRAGNISTTRSLSDALFHGARGASGTGSAKSPLKERVAVIILKHPSLEEGFDPGEFSTTQKIPAKHIVRIEYYGKKGVALNHKENNAPIEVVHRKSR